MAENPLRSELRPIPARGRLGDEAASYLRDALTTGAYRPGQRLGIEELAAQLGVSAMPVREALVTMANEGLLEVTPRRGFRVADLVKQDFEDVFLVHAMIAGLLAQRVAPRASDELIADLRDLQTQIERLGGQQPTHELGAEMEELNFRFHRRINRDAQGNRLRWFLRAATRFVPRHFYESIPGWTRATVEEHPAIVDAFARRDAYRARLAIEEHVLHAGRLVVAHLESQGFWAG